jgi:hypothetical protein
LEIKGEDVRRACKVAWKDAPHRVGVAFIDQIAQANARPSDEVSAAP